MGGSISNYGLSGFQLRPRRSCLHPNKYSREITEPAHQLRRRAHLGPDALVYLIERERASQRPRSLKSVTILCILERWSIGTATEMGICLNYPKKIYFDYVFP